MAGTLVGAHSQQLCDGDHEVVEVEEQSVLEALPH